MTAIIDSAALSERRKYIFAELVKIISTFSKAPETVGVVTPSSKLRDDIGIDSARLVDIWLDIESRFDVSIDESAMDGVATLDDLTTAVDHRWKGTVPTDFA